MLPEGQGMDELRYRALLIGNWHYPDDPPNLPDLKGPLNDISRLAAVMSDPQLGRFASVDVNTVAELPSYEIDSAMESFFGDATKDEVLLCYYSGYGLTDDRNAFLLCGRNSRTDRKRSTTVAAEEISKLIDSCAATAVVMILDCRYNGSSSASSVAEELSGPNRYVLASCRATDRATNHAQVGLSQFSGHLLQGMLGAAAQPGASHITVSDIHKYLQGQMLEDPNSIAFMAGPSADLPIARAMSSSTHVDELDQNWSTASTLSVSETIIDVGEVDPGERLPVERIYVTARTHAGFPAPWAAKTDARWIGLGHYPNRLEVTLTPRPDETRANIEIRNQETGATRTVRVMARLRQRHAAPERQGGAEAEFDRYEPSADVLPGALRNLNPNDRQRLIDGFLALSGMRDPNLRSLYVRNLEAHIGKSLELARYADARHDVWSLVGACLERPGTLRTLANILVALHGESEAVLELLRLVNEFDPKPGQSSDAAAHVAHTLVLADEYFLVAHRNNGNPINSRPILGAGLAGAIVGELVLSGQLIITDAIVSRTDQEDATDSVARMISEYLRSISGSCTVLDLITRLRSDCVLWIAQRLADRGLLVPESGGGLFRRATRYVPTDVVVAREPVARLTRHIIEADRVPDQQTVLLAALVNCTGLQTVFAGEFARGRVAERLAQISDYYLAPNLRTVVDAVDSAMALITYGPTRR
jgi:hypothetical protein